MKVLGLLAAIVLIAVLSLLLAYRDTTCSQELMDTPHLFVVTAYETETAAVRALTRTRSVCTLGTVTYRLEQHDDIAFMLFETGMGSEAAEHATKQTLEHFSVEILVLSGIAGGTHPLLTVGDTVVARVWTDVHTGDEVQVNEELVERAMLLSDVVSVEHGGTTDQFVDDTSTLPERVAIVDMETYVVARTARAYHIPFIAFRTISDNADGDERTQMFKQAAQTSAAVALEFLHIAPL